MPSCYQTIITEMMGGRCGERLSSMFEQQSPAIMVSRPIMSIHLDVLDRDEQKYYKKNIYIYEMFP